MSLRVDDRKGRSRSKSPSGRSRDRSSSHVRTSSSHAAPHGQTYDVRAPSPLPSGNYATSGNMMSGALPIDPSKDASYTMGDYSDLPPHERPGYVATTANAAAYNSQPQWAYAQNAAVGGGPAQPQVPRNVQYTTAGPSPVQFANTPTNITYTAKPVNTQAQPQPKVKHTSRPVELHQRHSSGHSSAHGQQYYPPPPPIGGAGAYAQTHPIQSPPPGAFPGSLPYGNVREAVPGGAGRAPVPMPMPSPGHGHRNSLSAGHGLVERVPSPGLGVGDMNKRMNRLSVSGGDRPSFGPGGMPPPSPLLEAYHGTYQSISPMPSPMMYARPIHDDIDDLPPLDRLSSHQSGRHRASSNATGYSGRGDSPPSKSKKSKFSSKSKSKKPRPDDYDDDDRRDQRRARIYDPKDDALDIVAAMSSRSEVDNGPLIDILPRLTHDQLLELRTEYKRHVRVQGHGINIAKHIKMKTTGTFGKFAYVTALGRWESEGYWANTWYQSGNTRRELLIEALMGRTNYEIRQIKANFRDKRYGDDLVKCMEKELKADKFRAAVLMVLAEERQEESELYEIELRNRDVDILYESLRGRQGGESAILGIVCRRSDAHLRDVLRTYERKFGGNFAREALSKSGNLVGEVVAHICNGVINRPARDAMLLHHAISDLSEPPPTSGQTTSSAKHERQQRYELLISRLVRLHWDRIHLERVKEDYVKKYREEVMEGLEDAVRSEDVLEFCEGLLGE